MLQVVMFSKNHAGRRLGVLQILGQKNGKIPFKHRASSPVLVVFMFAWLRSVATVVTSYLQDVNSKGPYCNIDNLPNMGKVTKYYVFCRKSTNYFGREHIIT